MLRRVRDILLSRRTGTALCFLTACLAPLRLHADSFPRIPSEPLPRPNAFDSYVRAGAALVDWMKFLDALSRRNPRTGQWEPSRYSLAQQEALVRENAPALKLIRSGFAYRYVSPQPRTAYAVPAYLPRLRDLATLLCLEGQVKAAHGDWNGAADCDLDAVRLGMDIPHGSAEMGWLYGLACQGMGRLRLWTAVPHLDARHAIQAARRLEGVEAHRTPFVAVERQEEWGGQANFIAIFRKPGWRKTLIPDWFHDLGVIDDPASDISRKALSEWVKTADPQTVLHQYTQYREQFVHKALSPYAAKVPIRAVPPDLLTAFGLIVFKYDPYVSLYVRDVSTQTENAFMIVVLALEAYRREHGAFPNTLSALVPRYLHRVPDDPFALAGSLRYHRTGTQYILYSVGPNGKDDHGAPISNRPQPDALPGSSTRIMDDSGGDIVAGVGYW